AEIEVVVRESYNVFDYKRVISTLSQFMTSDLSAFYFDIRKDRLYCDPPSSQARKATLSTLHLICGSVLKWLAPILCFTCEEAYLEYAGRPEKGSIHLQLFPAPMKGHLDPALAEKWRQIRRVRSVVTGALEIERGLKNIGSSLEAAPRVYVVDDALRELLQDIEFDEICITSQLVLETGEGPQEAFRLPEVPGVAVVVTKAQGRKCARSWKISPDVGGDPAYPDVTLRDAQALKEWVTLGWRPTPS